MTLGDKLRSLRAVEGSLRRLGRPMTQFELTQAMKREVGRGLSQAYLSQIESGARPHITHTTRELLARFFRVYPGFLSADPELSEAFRAIAEVQDSRHALLLLAEILRAPGLADRLSEVLRPGVNPTEQPEASPRGSGHPPPEAPN